jgi:SAM-dependent methyltransferase
MIQCQKSTNTCYNRHPFIFLQAAQLLQEVSPARVLSFGCSSGAEVRSLRDLGASHWTVDGAEINEKLLAEARAADPTGLYVWDAQTLQTESYAAVFAMSVLCRYGSPPEDFPFSTFELTLGVLVDLLRPGGILVIYNAQYDPRETRVASQLEAVSVKVKVDSGFVPKFTKAMDTELSPRTAKAVPYLYKKVNASIPRQPS